MAIRTQQIIGKKLCAAHCHGLSVSLKVSTVQYMFCWKGSGKDEELITNLIKAQADKSCQQSWPLRAFDHQCLRQQVQRLYLISKSETEKGGLECHYRLGCLRGRLL